MSHPQIIVVGGGAAGIFGAIAAAESLPRGSVTVLEKSPQFLTKVRISGGGRCNVTHDPALTDLRTFAASYPRGERALIGAFHRFQAADTTAWFESRGVRLKVESDGRVFPVTDSSQTILDCLINAARQAGVTLVANCGVESITRASDRAFALTCSNGERATAQRVLIATGGCRAVAGGRLATDLGNAIQSPVPSLFTFQIKTPWLRDLPGIAVEDVEVSVPGTKLRERGPLLVTHWGVSGPVVLRLSAWGARALHELQYHFPLHVNWLPEWHRQEVEDQLRKVSLDQGARLIVNTTLGPLPRRLWEQLVQASGIDRETRWSSLARGDRHRLIEQLTRTELPVSGKSLNKDEFVTCGGVSLRDVNFKTMESRCCPGLHFAGEVLDVDGITGGFNFQAAWTTGWIAGHAMAESLKI